MSHVPNSEPKHGPGGIYSEPGRAGGTKHARSRILYGRFFPSPWRLCKLSHRLDLHNSNSSSSLCPLSHHAWSPPPSPHVRLPAVRCELLLLAVARRVLLLAATWPELLAATRCCVATVACCCVRLLLRAHGAPPSEEKRLAGEEIFNIFI